MAVNDEDTATSSFLLPRPKRNMTLSPKKLRTMASHYGIMANCVDPACLASVTFRQRDGPNFSSAPPNAVSTDGKVGQMFGLEHPVQAAVDGLIVQYSDSLPNASLSLGARVVGNLAGKLNSLFDGCRGMKVISAKHCATALAVHLPMLGIFASSACSHTSPFSCRNFLLPGRLPRSSPPRVMFQYCRISDAFVQVLPWTPCFVFDRTEFLTKRG